MVQFSTTLAPQALSSLEMILGQLSPVESLTSDATATLDVSAADLSGVFWFRLDSNEFLNETTNTDLQFHCNSGNLVEIKFGDALVPAADIVSIGSLPVEKPIKEDIANWCTRLVLGTGAADLLDNEVELVENVDVSGNEKLFASMKALLQIYGGTPDAPRNNDPDTSTLDSTSTANNNYARQVLLSGIANNADEMIDRINLDISNNGGSSRVVDEFLPINPRVGDSLVLYAVYGSNNSLHLGSAGGPVVSPTLAPTYVSNLASDSPIFVNGFQPKLRYRDGINGSAKAWHVFQVTLNFN